MAIRVPISSKSGHILHCAHAADTYDSELYIVDCVDCGYSMAIINLLLILFSKEYQLDLNIAGNPKLTT